MVPLKANIAIGKKTINLPNKRKRGEEALTVWKKRSIFFTLSYWEDQVLHYNLDVMHIEKNVVDKYNRHIVELGWQDKG